MFEAEVKGEGFIMREGVVRNVLLNGDMACGRGEVLAQGEKIAIDRAQVFEDCEDVCFALAEAEHDAGFNERKHLFRLSEYIERTLVVSSLARDGVEPGHGFKIMGEDIGFCVRYYAQRAGRALEIRNEHFNFYLRGKGADRAYGAGEMLCCAVRKIVPGHGGDHCVAEPEFLDGSGNTARFIGVELLRFPFCNGAELAAPCADSACDEEGGNFLVKALADVGALRPFADRVEVRGAQEFLQPGHFSEINAFLGEGTIYFFVVCHFQGPGRELEPEQVPPKE